MELETRLYFAYGFNVNISQLRKKCTGVKLLGLARLPEHRLEFFGHSTIWDGAQETVVADPRHEVWGVLYQMEAYSWDELDNHEDARADGTGAYFHYPVEVMDERQSILEATIYKKASQGRPELPSIEYMAVIIQGAREQGLPESYIAYLQSLAAKPASYSVPRRPKFDKVGAVCTGDYSDCSVCGAE